MKRWLEIDLWVSAGFEFWLIITSKVESETLLSVGVPGVLDSVYFEPILVSVVVDPSPE